jgi:virulence-associated protein VapD
MSSLTDAILETLKARIWSGFDSPDDVYERLEDELADTNDGDEADSNFLREQIAAEFALKVQAETTWPTQTDCDRLDRAFEELNESGILALHDAGYTQSDGFDDVNQFLDQSGEEGVQGYCFYHGQDVERAVVGKGLYLAFGDLNDEPAASAEVGTAIRAVLEKHGFMVEWNGSSETRILLPQIDWKRRSSS